MVQVHSTETLTPFASAHMSLIIFSETWFFTRLSLSRRRISRGSGMFHDLVRKDSNEVLHDVDR